uniref:Coiled-coil domain containing 157 n=1 Tax=Oryzias melastigma TaxID=30732 RepID=A0A3B3C4S3_ORYME
MNSLLGRRDSINNLRKDIVDIQGAILDVLSRTGAVCASSWKFPDKLSCHLDIVALLEEYDFVEGEDDYNQHSHVVLLELMIDRFLLLLQSVSVYAEQQMGVYRPEGPTQRGGKSVGLVVRNYWGDLCQNSSKIFQKRLNQWNLMITTCSTHSSMSWSSTSSFKFIPQSDVAISSPEPTPFCPKTECHNVSCQTARTSLIPCDACRQVQSLLRKTGESLIDLFRSEGLPSSLQSLSADVDEKVRVGHMPAADVAQWANEQLRDMRRLAKHLQDVRGTVVPLQDRVAAAKMECETIKAQLETAEKEFKEKLEKHQANIEQLEFSLQEAERSAKETEKKHQEEHKQLQKGINHINKIEELDEECEELKKQLVDSEEAQIKLDNELQQMKQLQARITQKQLQKKNQRLETREDELKRQVSELTDHVRALRDRERLLVAFPELQNWAQPQTTGNVVLDMEQQLQANSIRVNILQQENTTLHKSLQKLRKAAQPNCSKRSGSFNSDYHWSHIISSRRVLRCPPDRRAGRTGRSPPGCRWVAPRSERPYLWAAAPAFLPCCARSHSQNTQRGLGKRGQQDHLVLQTLLVTLIMCM